MFNQRSVAFWKRDIFYGLIVFVFFMLLGGQMQVAVLEAKAAEVPEKLIVLSHRVHQTVSTQGEGGNVVADWIKKHPKVKRVEWLAVSDPSLRLLREASLKETDIDVGFMLNTQITPALKNLFYCLDDYMELHPVEDFDDIFPGLVNAVTFDGKLYGLPFRHATSGLHYNEVYFAECGIGWPPRTIEEFIEDARKLTYTRSGGQKVYGFIIPSYRDMHPNVVDLARAWDGDFITLNYEVACDEYGMVKAVETLRMFYEEGVFPEAFPVLSATDVNTWMQQGRAAMDFGSMGRTKFYGDPEQSKFPGKFKAVPIPISEEFEEKYDVAPAKSEFWCMMIPKNSRHKDLAWDFMRYMLSKEATIRSAINGNGPVRASTYENPEFRAKVPYADAEKSVLKVARVPLPGFDESARAADLFRQYVHTAVLGHMTPQQAMDKLAAEVEELLKKSGIK